MRVVGRDWLNASSIVLLQPGCNVVADTGYVSHAQQTLALLRRPEHLGSESLQPVANTHCHSDHMGSNALLMRTYGCPVAVPEGEAALIRNWDKHALWLDFADQRAERFTADAELAGSRRYCWDGFSWEAIVAPGHDMGALAFYCEATGLLISGDALYEHAFGVVLPGQPDALKASRATLNRIATLNVRVVIPGRGRPFTGVATALERCYHRVDAFQAEPVRMRSRASTVAAQHAASLFGRCRGVSGIQPNVLWRPRCLRKHW